MMTNVQFAAMVLGIVGAVTLLATGLVKYYALKRKKLECLTALHTLVSRFRLYKMLSYLGVDFDKYLNKIPQRVILHHVTNCRACSNIPTCDQCLRDGKVIADMHFCPNFHSLMVLSRTLK